MALFHLHVRHAGHTTIRTVSCAVLAHAVLYAPAWRPALTARNGRQGTLRVLLVLLHDLPEFLCEYHFELVSVVPTTCIQMRNLILSAFPRTMRLPDPFTHNLKVSAPLFPLYAGPSISHAGSKLCGLLAGHRIWAMVHQHLARIHYTGHCAQRSSLCCMLGALLRTAYSQASTISVHDLRCLGLACDVKYL